MSTPESEVSASSENQGRQLTPGLPGALCQCGCGVRATKASGYRWGYHRDPSVPVEERREALRLGGRRGVMTPGEVAQLYADLEIVKNQDDRNEARVRLLKLRAAGRLTNGMFRDQLAGLDSIGKDQRQAPPEPPRAYTVVLQDFSKPNSEASKE